jgi:hypothetical protein
VICPAAFAFERRAEQETPAGIQVEALERNVCAWKSKSMEEVNNVYFAEAGYHFESRGARYCPWSDLSRKSSTD